MKKEDLYHAMAYIDDKYLDKAEKYRNRSVFGFLHSQSRKIAAVLAVVLILAMGTGAYASGIFSPLNGDDFSLRSEYLGEGIVAVTIENRSEKDLHLQPKTKLMLFYANLEIPARGSVSFSETKIPAHEIRVIRIDLSEAYDIAMLEAPIEKDHYYLILTNNSFFFGHDWHCSVKFAPTDPK